VSLFRREIICGTLPDGTLREGNQKPPKSELIPPPECPIKGGGADDISPSLPPPKKY